jgi:PAS domain S-box-containing protein
MVESSQRPVTVVGGEEAWIVKSAHDAIVGMDAAGVIIYCNPAAARLYDHPLERLVGSRAEMLVPVDRRAEEAGFLRRIMAGGEVAPYRADRVRRDGTIVAVSTTISPIADATGTIIGAATMARRATMQDAHDRFEARVDRQRGEAQEASDRFEVRVGEQRAETRDAAARFERRVSAERVQSLDAEDGFQDQMDAERAQSQSDQEVLRSQLQQGQRVEVLGQLAGGVAHDVSNLLGVILDHATSAAGELALGPGADPAAAGRDVGQIRRAVERAAGLTSQLLAFARRDVDRPRALDLNHVVTDKRELLHRTLGADVGLRTELAEDLWPVLADPGQLERVLVALAVNARDAMIGGGELSIATDNITVESGRAASEVEGGPIVGPGRYVRLRVSDTGTGMSAEVAEHAFEPFFTTKPDDAGAGLGLATAYGIVAQADGSITVETEPGVGTTFTILIPATDEVPVPAAEPTAARRTPHG